MKVYVNLIYYVAIVMIVSSCSSKHRDNGWYPVDDSNNIEGEAIVTTNDFERVSLDTVTATDMAFIQGLLKQDKIPDWTDATERRIGKRIGFVYRDSVIMAPTVNCCVESGKFSINSSDKQLILEIYNSLDCEKTETLDVMPQKSYATAEGMTLRIISPAIIKSPIDSLVVEFTNSRKVEATTGEWFRIDRLTESGDWEEIPYNYTNVDSTGAIYIVFNDIGWIVSPNKPLQMTVNPYFYDRKWKPGNYRLAKTFHYPPYPRTEPSDTAYVEFEVK